MDAEISDVTDDAEMPEEAVIPDELVEAWANMLVDVHANIDQKSAENHTPMEDKESCESNSDTNLC